MFDKNPELSGMKVRGIEVHGMDELEDYIVSNDIHIAALAIPKAGAIVVAQRLVNCGIKAIWNFAPVHLDVPRSTLVQNENMATSLAVLSMHLQAQMKM